jgi:hypothetical protein
VWFFHIIWTLFGICIAYGLFAVFLPLKLLSLNLQLFSVNIGSTRYGGLIFIIIGTVINLKCYWDLIFTGKGTPDPLMPTEKLVARGLYQFVVFIEEPSLRRGFGESYDEYLGSVPRWIPRLRR